MSILASTPKQVQQNILRFDKTELPANSDLQARTSYVRAWYTCQDEKGIWHFGPSKFIGYKDMTAQEYLDGGLDGRRTEKQLSAWFIEVPEDDALYEELSDALTRWLHSYGKAPSSAFRINVSKAFYEAYRAADDTPRDDTIADLIIAVARSLAPAQRARVRAAL